MRKAVSVACVLCLMAVLVASGPRAVAAEGAGDADAAEDAYDDVEMEEEEEEPAFGAPDAAPPSEEERMNRAIIEHILQNIEPQCRDQLQALMSDPSAGHQMSEECNAQVQQAAATSDIAQEQQRKAQEELAQQETDKKRAASWIHPGVAISVFLIAVVAGVGGYLHHFHKNIKPNLKPYRAPKEKKRRA